MTSNHHQLSDSQPVNELLSLVLGLYERFPHVLKSDDLSDAIPQLSLIEETKLIEHLRIMSERLVLAADDLERRGVDRNDPELIVVAKGYRDAAVVIDDALASVEHDDDAPEPDVATSRTESKTDRRGMLRALASMAAIGVVGGALVAPTKAHATGEAAVLLPTLKEIFTTAREAYAVAVDTVNEIQQVGGFLNDLNNTFIGGIDSLFQQNESDTTKQITANAVAADRQVNTMLDIARTEAELGSAPGTSGCIGDGTTTVIEHLDKEVDESGALGGENSIQDTLLNTTPEGSDKRGEVLAEKLKRPGASDAFNGSAILFTQVPPEPDAEQEARELVEHLTSVSGKLIRHDLRNLASTPAGRSYIAAVTARETRRSVGAGVLTSINAERSQSTAAFDKLHFMLDSVIKAPSRESASDEEKRFDSRMVSLAQTLMTELEEMGGSARAISQRQAMDFGTRAFTTPTYLEIIRSSGPSSTPLLRELISISIQNLRYQSSIDDRLTQMASLLSLTLLEIQDSPDRLNSLSQMSSAL